jgi:YHS domain-containing protein
VQRGFDSRTQSRRRKEQFTVTDKTARAQHKGKHYVFCCPACKPSFDKQPEKYIGRGAAGAAE